MASGEMVLTPEIRAFEYALGLFSVLVGLAVADIATSFHRLIRRRASVRWDPLALLAAYFALCTVVNMWFDLWGVRNFVETRHYFFYLSLVGDLFLIFLIAAASLPDEFEGALDLRAFYAGNRRYFWMLVALYQLAYLLHGIYFVGGFAALAHSPWMLTANMLLPLLIATVLVVARSRAVHYLGLVALLALVAVHYARYAIV